MTGNKSQANILYLLLGFIQAAKGEKQMQVEHKKQVGEQD